MPKLQATSTFRFLILGPFFATLLCSFSAAGQQQESSLPDAPSFAQPVAHTNSLPLTPPPAGGQTSSTDTTPPPRDETNLKKGLKRGLEDQKAIYIAPFHRKNLKWDLLFLAGTGGLIALDKHASGALSREHTDVSQVISDIGLYSTVGAVGLLGISSLKTKDEKARETALLGAEAFANTFVVYTFTQLAAGRERPLEGNGNGDFWKNNTLGSSFPSGHSAFTWTLASVVAHEYPQPWVQWLSYGTATTVSVTRFTGLKHFPADVAVGAVFGYLIGQHIFHAHCKHCRNFN
jgi:membrane-associated phospholipid phosphatase